jgi:hypothetical protein
MDPASIQRKEPRVPGPNAGHRIPPTPTGNVPIAQTGRKNGVSVPVYPKLPDRAVLRQVNTRNRTFSGAFIFDACLALVSVAFCILFFSEL